MAVYLVFSAEYLAKKAQGFAHQSFDYLNSVLTLYHFVESVTVGIYSRFHGACSPQAGPNV